MTLSRFIQDNMEAIVAEWASFAMTMEPAASTMSLLALRDHAKPILLAIASDIAQAQTADAQEDKSKGLAPLLSARETAAATHGALRHVSGFDLNQLGAEYRALRASVIRLWTQEKQAQMDSAVIEDMIRFNEAVDQAVAESTRRYAAELSLSRDTFMAILAHDLRSPLNAITMLSQLVEMTGGSDKTRLQGSQIRRSAGEMATMIRDLLEYTRTQLGKGIPVKPAAADMAEICALAVAEVRSGHPGCQLVLDAPAALPARFDAARMRQALSNLLNNAVQHGGGSAVVLRAAREGDEVVIEVTNHGEPIAPDSLQVIFDPLVQLSAGSGSKADRPASNLGLGLFIAREVVSGHGGTIEARSSTAEGTVFAIRLPADGPDQSPAAGR